MPATEVVRVASTRRKQYGVQAVLDVCRMGVDMPERAWLNRTGGVEAHLAPKCVVDKLKRNQRNAAQRGARICWGHPP